MEHLELDDGLEKGLRSTIQGFLDQINIDAKLQEAVTGGATKAAVGSELLDELEQSGFLDDLMGEFNIKSNVKKRKSSQKTRDGAGTSTADPPQININYMRRQLLLQVDRGKAFTAHLLDQPALPGHKSPTYTLHVSFRGQRYRSTPVICCEEPEIRESFLLELHRDDKQDVMLNVTDLLSLADKIHFVLVKTNPNSETITLSSTYLEWRSLLSSSTGKQSLSLEMMGIGAESSIPVGLLDLTMSVIPVSDVLEPEVVSEQMKLEKAQQAERDRLFMLYTKRWWTEYLEIRQSHANRIVKFYAKDENHISRPVCSYVQPLRCGRLLENPRQAARFVSLIKYDKPATVGNSSRIECWSSLHTFLVTNKGDSENHATLLCSLLIGFGLNAYVCLGTKNKSSPHAWVVTIGPDDGIATFWESLSSNRYIHKHPTADNMLTNHPPTPKHPYRTVGCVFNHAEFYANIQTNDDVTYTDFNLRNSSSWKSMESEAISSVCSPSVSWMTTPPLQKPIYDSVSTSNSMEIEFRAMITEYRERQGLTTIFDDQCSFMLSMALSGYETERITGQAYGNEEFSQAITNLVPNGHTFKAYPMQFMYVNAARSFAAAIRSSTCAEVLSCRGDSVRMAVRVCVYPYPEYTVAAWVMFACKYKSIL